MPGGSLEALLRFFPSMADAQVRSLSEALLYPKSTEEVLAGTEYGAHDTTVSNP